MYVTVVWHWQLLHAVAMNAQPLRPESGQTTTARRPYHSNQTAARDSVLQLHKRRQACAAFASKLLTQPHTYITLLLTLTHVTHFKSRCAMACVVRELQFVL
jgi:hypothetical protein